MTVNPAVEQDVGPVRRDVIENEAGVADDQASFLPIRLGAFLLEQSTDHFSHYLNVFQINPGLGLVQQSQPRILNQQLEQFGALQFPAGKSVVYLSVEERGKAVGFNG